MLRWGAGEEDFGGFCEFLLCCRAGAAGLGHFLPHWQCVWPCCTLLAHVQAPHLQTKYWRFWPIAKEWSLTSLLCPSRSLWRVNPVHYGRVESKGWDATPKPEALWLKERSSWDCEGLEPCRKAG